MFRISSDVIPQKDLTTGLRNTFNPFFLIEQRFQNVSMATLYYNTYCVAIFYAVRSFKAFEKKYCARLHKNDWSSLLVKLYKTWT